VTLDDWILALHVLSAFAFVGAVVLFWVLIVAGWNVDLPEDTLRVERLVKVGNAAVAVGAGGTIVLGIWLAFSVGDHDIWDPWIVAALVLWGLTGFAGQRTGKAYARATERARELESGGATGASAELLALNRTQEGLVMHTLTSLLLVLILVDMIWKPGA